MKTIPLTQGKVALVDDEDFESVNAHKWHAHKKEAAKACDRAAKRRFKEFALTNSS